MSHYDSELADRVVALLWRKHQREQRKVDFSLSWDEPGFMGVTTVGRQVTVGDEEHPMAVYEELPSGRLKRVR